MKKVVGIFTAVFFVAALGLNLSFDANGNFTFFNSVSAKSDKVYKGPSVWNCRANNMTYAYATVCTDEGQNNCVPTACPDPPQ